MRWRGIGHTDQGMGAKHNRHPPQARPPRTSGGIPVRLNRSNELLTVNRNHALAEKVRRDAASHTRLKTRRKTRRIETTAGDGVFFLTSSLTGSDRVWDGKSPAFRRPRPGRRAIRALWLYCPPFSPLFLAGRGITVKPRQGKSSPKPLCGSPPQGRFHLVRFLFHVVPSTPRPGQTPGLAGSDFPPAGCPMGRRGAFLCQMP